MSKYTLGQRVRVLNVRTGVHYATVGEPFWQQDGPGPRYRRVVMPDGAIQDWERVKNSLSLFQDMLK